MAHKQPYSGSLIANTRGTFVGALGSNNLENYLPPPINPLRIGLMGATPMNINHYVTGGNLFQSNAGWFNWAQVLTDHLFYAPVWLDPTTYVGWEPDGIGTRGFMGFNAGVSGQTVAQIMARRDYFINTYNANLIVIDMGANDLGGSGINLSKEAVQTAREQLALYYLKEGKTVILLPILMRDVTGPDITIYFPGWASGGAARKQAEWCNEKTRQFVRNYPNLYFFDWNAPWIDWTTAATQTQGVPKTGYTWAPNGSTPSGIGAYAIGKAFATFIKTILPITQPRLWTPSNLFDATDNPLGNIFSNAPLTGTDGTITSATGTVASTCTVTGSANCTTVATAQTARADGLGYWQQLVLTPGGTSSAIVTFTNTSDITHGLSNGDWYQFSVKIACDGNASLTDVYVRHMDGTTASTVYNLGMINNGATLPTEAWSGTIVCPPLQVQSTTVTNFEIKLNTAATGTATTVQIGSIELRKVENPLTFTAPT